MSGYFHSQWPISNERVSSFTVKDRKSGCVEQNSSYVTVFVDKNLISRLYDLPSKHHVISTRLGFRWVG